MENTTFEGWALVEIMGHVKVAGMASTLAFGNTVLLRVDIPETKRQPALTKMYGMGSIYCLTPTAEDVARAHAEVYNINPINEWQVGNMIQKRIDAELENAVSKRLRELGVADTGASDETAPSRPRCRKCLDITPEDELEMFGELCEKCADMDFDE